MLTRSGHLDISSKQAQPYVAFLAMAMVTIGGAVLRSTTLDRSSQGMSLEVPVAVAPRCPWL